MNIIIALIITAMIGFVAYLIATLLPFTAPIASVIGLVIAVLAFLVYWQGGRGVPPVV